MSRDPDESEFQFGSGHPVSVTGTGGRRHTWLLAAVALLVVLAGTLGLLYFQPQLAPGWLRDTGLVPVIAPAVVYKWQDSNGDWQITDVPPAPGTPFQRLEYGSQTNVMPLVPRKD